MMTSPEQELEECLKDKCCTAASTASAAAVASPVDNVGHDGHDDANGCAAAVPIVDFHCLPDFAETVAFLHQFGDLFALSPFSFDDLAQALHQLHPAPTVQQHQYCPPNLLLDTLFAEILHYCGFKIGGTSVYNSLHKLIRRVNRWTPTPFDADLLYRNGDDQMAAAAVGSATADNDENDDGDEKLEQHQQQQQQLQVLDRTDECKVEEAEQKEEQQRTDDRPELSNLSNAQVLRLIVLLFDYLLQCVHEDGGLDPKFSDEQLHPKPLCVDPAGRKFWYFTNDTWLFMEQDRPTWMEEDAKRSGKRRSSHDSGIIIGAKKETPPATKTAGRKEKKKTKKRKKERYIRTIYDKKKRRKNSSEGGEKKLEEEEEEKERQMEEEEKEAKEEEVNITWQELDKACENLFTGTSLRPVCTCSDHFSPLISAYRNQTTDQEAHGSIADTLEQCMHQVRNIEQERRRKAAERERERWAAAARMSSRVYALMEKRRLEEEQMRARKERILAEKRRLAEEQLALLREHRCLTDSDLRQNISREERHRLRQQRLDEQRERDQLVAAGLLEHDDGDRNAAGRLGAGTAAGNNAAAAGNDHADDDDDAEDEGGVGGNRYDGMEEEEEEEDDDDDDEDEQWWKMEHNDNANRRLGQQQRHPTNGGGKQRQRGRLLPVSRPICARRVRRHCRFWRWAPEAPVPSKIATFAQLPSPSASFRTSLSPTTSTTATTAALSECASGFVPPPPPSTFCLLMGEQQLPVEVKRKMSSFFAESMGASSSSSSSTPSAAIFNTASSTAGVAKKASAICSIRSVLQLSGTAAK